MYSRLGSALIFLVASVCFCFPSDLMAMTAPEILDEVVKQSFGAKFRVIAKVKTLKRKKTVSKHSIWLMGEGSPEETRFFVEFDAPPESKGLRFLFVAKREEQPQAFMFVSATGKTLPLAADDPSTDIAGTGLTMGDFIAAIAQPGQKETLVKEEKAGGRDCYVIRITAPNLEGKRLMWVSKDHFHVIKSRHVGTDGKVKRDFRVKEFYKTKKGREYPREEEITVPGKRLRIIVRQSHAVFGADIPEELMKPATFGKYSWRP